MFCGKFKQIWWVVLLVILGVTLTTRVVLSSGQTSDFDLGLLAMIAAVAVIPFFSEFSFLGLTFKRELDLAKKEIKQDIREQNLSLRAELLSVSNTTNVLSVTSPHYPVPESVLQQARENAASLPGVSQQDLSTTSLDINQVPRYALIAFASYYRIKSELERIWKDSYSDFSQKPVVPNLYSILKDLKQRQIISDGIALTVEDVLSITNPIIYGAIPPPQYTESLEALASFIISVLQSIQAA